MQGRVPQHHPRRRRAPVSILLPQVDCSSCMAQRTPTESHRWFSCARCRGLVRLCTSCDRGQWYCGPECSAAARRANRREANQRYQRTDRGRSLHAQRQARYRARSRPHPPGGGSHVTDPLPPGRRSRVTDQGSSRAPREAAAASEAAETYLCARCGRQVSRFARWNPISEIRQRHRRRKRRGRPR